MERPVADGGRLEARLARRNSDLVLTVLTDAGEAGSWRGDARRAVALHASPSAAALLRRFGGTVEEVTDGGTGCRVTLPIRPVSDRPERRGWLITPQPPDPCPTTW